MSTPPTDPGRPSPDDDQGRSTPWGGTPWGAAPWGGPPAPSGYEAQLPGAGTASGTGAPDREENPPASPYAAPRAPGPYDAAPTGAPAPPTPPGTPPYTPGPPPGSPYPGSSSFPNPYPAPPYPAAPYPASPYPSGGGYPVWAPPPPPTDGLAVASLIVSCSSLVVGLSAPVGLGLGIAALRRIRRTGAQGRGLAIAGIVVGGIMTAAAVVLVAFFVLFAIGMSSMSSSSDPDSWSSSSGSSVDDEMPAYVLRTDLRPGDCLLDVPATYDLSDAVAVGCDQPHTAEVLSTLTLSGPVLEDLDAWDPVYADLADRCAADTAALLGPGSVDAVGWSEVYYPHPDEWADGGRTAYCVLGTTSTVTGSALTGTFAGGSRTVT